MFSVYTTDGKLAYVGPDGKPFEGAQAALASAEERSERAASMGLMARYEAKRYVAPRR